jgi:long-chain acyl-CoA synthetase
MVAGGHCIVAREPIPAELLALIERHRITHSFLVPALLNFLTAVPGAAERDYSALRTIVYGASPITEDVLERAMTMFGCQFVQVYGLTETAGAITQLPFSDHQAAGPDGRLLRSAGRPFDWVQLRVVDSASGDDLPPAEVGEVWTRSPQNMAGYWNHPDDTAAAYEGEWLRTGDAGYLDEAGYLFLTDRVKDMIVSGGENVYPAEVENALSGHPAVADVGVIGVPDAKWGETVKAIVVRTAGTDPSPAELIAFARQRLASYKCPTTVDFTDTLPRNPSGKILKRELREPYWLGHRRRIN